jgi:hypothetical protein
MSDIIQVPVETADDNAPTEPLEAIQEEPAPEAVEEERHAVEKAVAKPKAKMGRPTGKKDAKPRAKPKPKAKARVQERAVESDTESSPEDEASLQELHALRLMRAVRSYDQSRLQRKTDRYASWFGR